MNYKFFKISAIMIMVALFFVSCQKESKYIDSYVISKNGYYGLIDSIGHEIVSPNYIYIEPIQKAGVSLAVIDTIYTYECDSTFLDVRNSPILNIKYGYINSDNKFLFPHPSIVKIKIDSSIDSINSFFEFCNNFSFYGGLAIAQDTITKLYGFINLNGDTIISPKYKNARIFNQGRAAVQSFNGKWGLINSEGENVCDFVFTALETPVNGRAIAEIMSIKIHEGLKVVGTEKGDKTVDDLMSRTDTDNVETINFKSFLVDENGKIKEELNMVYQYFEFSKEGIAVAVPNKLGEYFGLSLKFITKDGKFLNPLTLENMTEYQVERLINSKYFLNEFLPKDIEFQNVTCFSDGYAAVGLGKGWIFVDTQLIPRGNEKFPVYERALPFAHKLAGVKLDGKFGYINDKFEIAIPCEYDSCAIAGKNLCRVYSGEKTKKGYPIVSYIDRDNNIVWQSVNYSDTYFKGQDNNGVWRDDIRYVYIGKSYTLLLCVAIIIALFAFALFLIIKQRKKRLTNSQRDNEEDLIIKIEYNVNSKANISTDIAQCDKSHEIANTTVIESETTRNCKNESKPVPTIDKRLNNLLEE